MTTCISAICYQGLIVGASDRMLTFNRGEIEFELRPTSTGDNFPLKITPLNATRSIVLMMAGDISIQTEIVLAMLHTIEKSEKEAAKIWSVKEAVNLYIDCYDDLKSKVAESAVLSPLGLKRQDFLTIQKSLSDEFSKDIALRLGQFQFDVETIITGFDESGPHLYKLQENFASCCDGLGFAAIGIGARHAESQFMLQGYCRLVPQEEALWLTYMAKRRSEIAAGVGKITDLFRIGGKDKKFDLLNNLEPRLAAIYDTFEKQESAAFGEAQKGVKSFLEELQPKTSQ